MSVIYAFYAYSDNFRVVRDQGFLIGAPIVEETCMGLYIETYDQRSTDGGRGGWCIGVVKKKVIREAIDFRNKK